MNTYAFSPALLCLFGRLLHDKTISKPLILAALCAVVWPNLAYTQSSETTSDGALQSVRLETIVVTASRREQSLGDIAASMEVIDATAFETTSGAYLTDIIKKNASVDVIEYPGGLSGVGLRGFRPQFSGVNQRVLVLVDGRPSGATSLANISRAGVERVEILKGSASAAYGPSVMGGVVNIITRKSDGDMQGNVSTRFGSFDTLEFAGSIGGALNDRLNFDLGVLQREQGDNYRLGKGGRTFGDFVQGHGAERDNTRYTIRSFFARGAVELTPNWEAQLRFLGYDGIDLQTPGAESSGVSNQSDKVESNFGGDFSLTGQVGDHSLLALAYTTHEDYTYIRKPAGATPYRSSARDTYFRGVQLQDNWQINDVFDVIVGLDWGRVDNESQSYRASGAQRGSFTPYFNRRNIGVFADMTAWLLDDRLIVSVGGRYDEIESELEETPLRPDVKPGTSSFSVFNPRLSAVYRTNADSPWRVHASLGTGFISPEANRVAGLYENLVGDQLRITRGNNDLGPEESVSFDIGFGYESYPVGLDVTYFRLDVDDRVESIITINTDALRETTYINTLGSLAEGLEATAQFDLGALAGAQPGSWTGDVTATRYFTREQEVASGTIPIRNVARFKVNFSLGYGGERFGVRLNGRHVNEMFDTDFSRGRIFTGGAGGTYEYPDFVVFDLYARWNPAPEHRLSLQVDNLEDEYYFEKGDYPFAGRSYYVAYQYGF